MSSLLRTVLMLAVAVSLCSPTLAADGPLARLFRPRPTKSTGAPLQQPQYVQQHAQPQIPQARYDRESLNESYRQMYPKYYGGFHSRTLMNYGYAPGDIGFRGGLTYPGMPW